MLDVMGAKSEEEMDVGLMLRAQGIRMQSIERNQETFDARQEQFDSDLKMNNESTKRIEASTTELVNILNSWKGAIQVLELIGKVMKPIGIVVGIGASVAAFVISLKGGK